MPLARCISATTYSAILDGFDSFVCSRPPLPILGPAVVVLPRLRFLKLPYPFQLLAHVGLTEGLWGLFFGRVETRRPPIKIRPAMRLKGGERLATGGGVTGERLTGERLATGGGVTVVTGTGAKDS